MMNLKTLAMVLPVFLQCSEHSSGSQMASVTEQKVGAVESALASLKVGASDKDVAASLKVIRDLKGDGLSGLLANLKNSEEASPRHFRDPRMMIDPETGELKPAPPPRIGDVAFMLLREQLEGSLPLAYRDYLILSPENVEQWLRPRLSKELKDLRLELARASLRKAERDAVLGKKTAIKAVEYLARRLREIEQE
jgi:hypothetical protein